MTSVYDALWPYLNHGSTLESGSGDEQLPPCLPRKAGDIRAMNLAVETEQESDGRWLAEIPQIPGVMAYGATRQEAIARAEALALRVFAERHPA